MNSKNLLCQWEIFHVCWYTEDMIYPQYLKKHDLIGVTAPSAGVGRKLDSYERSLACLEQKGWRIRETASVRNDAIRSTTAGQRAQELRSLFLDPDVKMVLCAAGGDFLLEMLPYVNFRELAAHPKWLMGASDPTGLLYPLTTLYDIATLYGCNAGSYDCDPLPDFLQRNLEFLSGKKPKQHSYEYWTNDTFRDDGVLNYDLPVHWSSTAGSFQASGRCIGGCMDVLKDLIGTKFDGTRRFLKRYQKDGFIWYFDNYSLSAENFYRTLLQFKAAGWLENANAILIGRTLFESSETGMSYEDAVHTALNGCRVLYNADIGHTEPFMTMINGAYADVRFRCGKATVSFRDL